MKTFSLIAAASLILFVGCSTPQLKPDNALLGLGGEWKSIDSSATARFENGRVSGSDGCNRYGAAFTAGENTLAISDKMMSTMMMCPGETMKNAQQFRDALLRASRYRNDGKTLTLMDGSLKPLLRFVPAAANP